MKIENNAVKYHYAWLGASPNKKGVQFVYSSMRNVQQVGYSFKHDLICCVRDKQIIFSYGDKASEKIEELKLLANKKMPVEELADLITSVYVKKPNERIHFIYSNKSQPKNDGVEPKAQKLTHNDLDAYLTFYKECNQPYSDMSWLNNYFTQMVNQEFCHGVFVGNKLVSAADCPVLPIMSDIVQEIGVSTVEKYHKMGYAKESCRSLIQLLLSKNICPIWSTSSDNNSSIALAKNLGFKFYSTELWLTL